MQDKVLIAKYLKERLRRLGDCAADVENRWTKDTIEFINSCDCDDVRVKYLSHMEGVLANTFRYSMLIAVCTFLEEAVKAMCALSVTDYERKLQKSGDGTWLARHQRLLTADASVDLTAIAGELAEMEDFIQVRNCIAHAWGNVKRCRNSRIVEQIVQRGGRVRHKRRSPSVLRRDGRWIPYRRPARGVGSDLGVGHNCREAPSGPFRFARVCPVTSAAR
jgi:hypothetical protein